MIRNPCTRSTTIPLPEFVPTDQTIIGTTAKDPFYVDRNVIQTGAEKYFYVVTMNSPNVDKP